MKSISVILVLLFANISAVIAQEFDGVFGSTGRVVDKWNSPLWHGETANTSSVKSGALTIAGASRYGLKSDLELSSHLAFSYFIPNLAVKKLWRRNEQWVISSRHSLYSATPGLNWAQKQEYGRIVGMDDIPFILSSNNELLISKPYIDKMSCSGIKPWLILTGGIALGFGVPFSSYDDQEMMVQFLANRGEAFAGRGFYGVVKFRADWEMSETTMLRGGIKYFGGSFSGHHAVELFGDIEYFFNSRLSISGDCMISIANYDGLNNIGILPFANLSWYFGRRETLSSGLFEKDVQKSYSRKKNRSLLKRIF